MEARRLLAGQLFPGEGPNVNNNPIAVVSADLNADGKADLVTASFGNGTVSVSLGDGAGGFAAPVAYAAGTSPRVVAVADFNGDGKLDLAVANFTTAGGVSILKGNGDGTFAAATSVAVGGSTSSVAVGDFDADGKIDLATSNNANGTVTISRGNGDGTFNVQLPVTVAAGAYAIVAADFTGDGKLDFATANRVTGNGSVSIVTGNGNGTFASVFTPSVGSNTAQSLAAGDFNADGKADLVVGFSTGSSVAVLLSLGGGFTSTPAYFTTAASPYGVTTGDFNGDGKVDVAAANLLGTSVSLLVGDGAGSFAVSTVPSGRYGYAIATGDFNGDGRPDLAVSSYSAAVGVSVLLNNGGGSFVLPVVTAFGTPVFSAVTADFNGDGRADVAVIGQDTSSVVRVALGNGSGGFAAPVAFGVGTNPFDLVAADLNGDGIIDLTTANYNDGAGTTVSFLRGTGSGAFAAAQSIPVGTGPFALTAADVNGDGVTDLVTANDADSVTVVFINAAGVATTRTTALPAGSYPADVAAADFNGDGRVDLALATDHNGIAILLGNGNGTFAAATSVLTTAQRQVVVGDLNGDGRPDLLVTDYAGGTVTVALNSGFGFNILAAVAAGPGPFSPVVADFNGDGKADVVVSSGSSTTIGTVSVLLGNGTGTLAPAATTSAITGIGGGIAVADFNGDNRPDVASSYYNGGAGGITVLLNQQTANPYVTVAGGVVTLSGTTTPLTAGIAGGVLSIGTPAGTVQVPASTITGIVLSGVNLTVGSDLGPASGDGPIGVTVGSGSAITFLTSEHLRALTVNGTATLAAGGGKLLRTAALSVDAAGRLDLNDNDLVYDYATPAGQVTTVRNQIASGRAGGTWTGFGLTSTAAKNNPTATTTLGYMEASDYKSIYGNDAAFDGETIDGTTVLVKYTLYGDADFNRKVDFNDFLRLQNGYGTVSGATFATGDFTYDGKTDFNDFLALQNNYNVTLSDRASASSHRL